MANLKYFLKFCEQHFFGAAQATKVIKNITIKKNDGATPIVNVDLTYSGAEPIFAFCRMNSGCSSSWNFGNPIAALSSANSDPNGYGSFEYSTTLNSVDYYALCTKNLAEHG